MKYCLFCFIIILTSCSSTKKVERLKYPDPFEFLLVDTLPAAQNDLYVRAHEWIAKNYGSAKDVIQMQDKEAGKIIGKGLVTAPATKYKTLSTVGTSGPIRYTVSIDARENKYRVVISNIYQDDYTYIQYGKTVLGTGIGSLSQPFKPIKDPATHTYKPSREERYYELRNFCLNYFTQTLADLKSYMQTNPDKF